MNEFDLLQQECARLVEAHDFNSDHWHTMFERFLQRPELAGADARAALEALLAEWFEAGWQPGSDLLLAAAAKAFGWDGATAGRIGAALLQYSEFRNQPTPLLNMQWAAIRHMREGIGKDGRLVRRTLTYFLTLREHYPAWLHMATSQASIREWSALADKAPEAVRQEYKDARWPKMVQLTLAVGVIAFVGLRLSAPKPPQKPRLDHYVARTGDFKPNRDWINGVIQRIDYRAADKPGPGMYRVTLTKLGNVESVQVEQSSGSPAFDQAAMRAIRNSPGFASDIARTFTLTL